MTAEEIERRLIENDALFNNILVIEQDFDIIPRDKPHLGASITFQDIRPLRKSFLEQLVDTVVDWVYGSEKYKELRDQFKKSGKSDAAAASEIIRKASQKFRKSDDTLLAQNIIIRNPHLYTRHHSGATELTNYEMANLRGRAGRLLKDFVGRTIVLDESEFESAEGYDQFTLFEDTTKEISPGYAEKFVEYQDEVLDVVESGKHVSNEMQGYGYLVTYIRQTVMRYGRSSRKRLAETGINLTPKQVAAIVLKLKDLSVPKSMCINNRYWDPVILDDIFKKFNGDIPNNPTERGAKSKLSNLLLFLRENETTSDMYSRYIPAPYQRGEGRGLLCSTCIKWSSEIPLSKILSGQYYEGERGAENIEKTIKLLQETVSFNVPMLIKPLMEMSGGNSIFISCLQTGSYKKATKKMIEIGVPRELAIKLSGNISFEEYDKIEGAYAQEIYIREKLQQLKKKLSYWEKVQLDFINDED